MWKKEIDVLGLVHIPAVDGMSYEGVCVGLYEDM